MSLIYDIKTMMVSKMLMHHFMTSQDLSPRTVVETIEVSILLDDGSTYSAEIVTPPYICGETPDISLKALAEAKPELIELDVLRHKVIVEILDKWRDKAPAAMAGVEMAVWKCIGAITRTPLWTLWGGYTQQVVTDFTIPMQSNFAPELDAAVKDGFSIIKVKMGILGKDREIAGLRRMYDLHPDIILRVDANQAFTQDEALRVIEEIQEIGIQLELLEQPTPADDLEALRVVTASAPIPIIADESVRTFSDALRICEEGAADGFNIKLMKSGIAQAMSMIALAKATDKRLMIGCMLEGAANIDTSLALACGTGAFDYIDLDSFMFVQDNINSARFKADGPYLMVD